MHIYPKYLFWFWRVREFASPPLTPWLRTRAFSVLAVRGNTYRWGTGQTDFQTTPELFPSRDAHLFVMFYLSFCSHQSQVINILLINYFSSKKKKKIVDVTVHDNGRCSTISDSGLDR